MPKTSKKTNSTPVDSPVVKHSVPTVGERSGPQKSGVMARFSHTAKTTKKVKDDERPIVDLDASTQEKFVQFACTRELFKMVESRDQRESSEIVSEVYEKYIETLWLTKKRPKNPSIQAHDKSGKLDATGMFIVSGGSRIKIDMMEVGEDEQPRDTLVRTLVAKGVEESNASRLVDEQVKFDPQWMMNLTDLMVGSKDVPATDVQISTAEVLFCAVRGHDLNGSPIDLTGRLNLLKSITEDGWNQLESNMEKRTTYYPTLVDGDTFLDNICDYADSFEELKCVLSVFVPVKYCNSVKFAVSDNENNKKTRMLAASKDIVGVQ